MKPLIKNPQQNSNRPSHSSIHLWPINYSAHSGFSHLAYFLWALKFCQIFHITTSIGQIANGAGLSSLPNVNLPRHLYMWPISSANASCLVGERRFAMSARFRFFKESTRAHLDLSKNQFSALAVSGPINLTIRVSQQIWISQISNMRSALTVGPPVNDKDSHPPPGLKVLGHSSSKNGARAD